MDEAPSNAVLLAKLESLGGIVIANQLINYDAHTRILEQTTKTNGRVTALEKAKNVMLGILIVIHILILPIIIALVLKYLKA